MANFETELRKLNNKQREAVEAIDGPVMVIAGPGTGKTQILTLRIANILHKTDTSPDAILALTFTESAVANMRKRLAAFIGNQAYYVRMHTFHGFCNRLIQDYPEHFETIANAKAATPVDQIAIVRGIIEEGGFMHLKPFGEKFFYVREIVKSVRHLKSEGFDPEAFATLVARDREEFAALPEKTHASGKNKGERKSSWQRELKLIEKNEELAQIYAAYQKKLREKKLYDFEDMLLETIRALEAKNEFLLELQEQFQYFLVDEHQDTNGAQNRILELLASFYQNPNLFVVGDEKQAIFRFQGASLDNFLYFKDRFRDVRLINLEDNYRSTQQILDSAQSLIEKNVATLPAALRSWQGASGNPICIVTARTPEAEYAYVADDIAKKLRAGEPAREIAVLFRENRDAAPLSAALEKAGIAFAIEADRNVLEDPEMQKFLAVLLAVERIGEDEPLIAALHVDFFDIDPLDVYQLLDARREKNMSLWKLIAHPERLEHLGLEHPETVAALYKKLSTWGIAARNESLPRFFDRLARESGFLEALLAKREMLEKLDLYAALFSQAERIAQNNPAARLAEFSTHVAILKEHGIGIPGKHTLQADAVRLMTAHRAKGLEFDTVYITGAYDGHWGNKRAATYFTLPYRTAKKLGEVEKNEDERRLFYMALTRARANVCVSYAATSEEGRERVPSQFIAELRDDLKVFVEADVPTCTSVGQTRILATSHKEPAGSEMRNVNVVRKLFARHGLSATSLNNYLACPWRYFYVNLLRIPKAQTLSQQYGIAVHAALERLFAARAVAAADPYAAPSVVVKADAAYLIEQFRKSLERMPLTDREFSRLAAKGEKTLAAYFAFWIHAWSWRTVTEYAIQISLPNVVDIPELADGIPLSGKLDKLELQKNPGEVIVVDYKTKEPESRNWIEGKTANSTGDYKRQLVFYRLLMDQKPQNPYRMIAGAIDFVEPNDRGIFKRELFEITDEEVTELKATIVRVTDEIVHVKFWNRRCDDTDCEFCKIRAFMQ